MRNFVEKLNLVKKIKEEYEKREKWKNYSSTLPISNNIIENNKVIQNIFVEEKRVENTFNVCSSSKEGCRGEYDDELDYLSYLEYLFDKNLQLWKKDRMLKFNSWKIECSKKINGVNKFLSYVKNFKFSSNALNCVKNGFNIVKDGITNISFKELKKPKIEVVKFYQSEGDVVYNWIDKFASKIYVIDRTNQSKVAVVLNEGIKFFKKCHLVKDNKFTRYIEKKSTAKVRLANPNEAYFIDKNNNQDDVVWYYPKKINNNNNNKVNIKMPNLFSILNLHKPQNQAYLVKSLTAASLTLAIGLSCAYPVSGLVSKIKEFIDSEKNIKQVVTVEADQMDFDDYVMYKTYGAAYNIDNKEIDKEYYKEYVLPTKKRNVNSVYKKTNIKKSVINIGDNVTTCSNTIYKGVNDAINKVGSLKASYSNDTVREVELIGLDYEGKIVYSSDQKVIDEYRMKGAVDTAYLTYIDGVCEGYYASDNVKKLVKTL